jgi:CRP-like cAMP-binding protein
MLPIPDTAISRHVLARGDLLFQQGDRAAAVYFVEKGCLRLERRTFDGRVVTLHTARAGELFAEASLFPSVTTATRSLPSHATSVFCRRMWCSI